MAEESYVKSSYAELQRRKVYVRAGRFLVWWWAVASRGSYEKMGVSVFDARAAAERARRHLNRVERRNFEARLRDEELSD